MTLVAVVLAAAVGACPTHETELTVLPADIRAKVGAPTPMNPCKVDALPASVRDALARALGQAELAVADPGGDWNAGCLVSDELPYLQLIFAGRSGDTWLVHLRQPQLAPSRLMVVAVDAEKTRLDWSGSCMRTPLGASPADGLVGGPRDPLVCRPEDEDRQAPGRLSGR
jgi:hypothetical protein